MTPQEKAVLEHLSRGFVTASYWLYRAMGVQDRWPAKKGYPVLRKMLRAGLIEGTGGDINYNYKITQAGRDALANK